MPLIWIARLLNIPLAERVAGSSLFEKLRLDKSNQIKVYFFGGPPGVAATACKKLNDHPAGMRCIGFESPGFGSLEEMSSPEVVDRINRSEADFLVVALGAKKGNAWIEYSLSQLAVPVVSHLGAVVNFVAGSVSRAPLWMQRVGLEWVWRIREEPQLWILYFNDGVAFIRLLLTCVLPYTWYLRALPTLPSDCKLPEVYFEEDNDGVRVYLKGAFVQNGLDSLKNVFALAAQKKVNVKVDLAEVTYVDSAIIGSFMLLYWHQHTIGKQFLLLSAKSSVAKVFKWSGAKFLLGLYGE